MARVVVEINGERHVLVKDRTFEMECSTCSLRDKCNRLEAICSIFKEHGGSYHFIKEGRQ